MVKLAVAVVDGYLVPLAYVDGVGVGEIREFRVGDIDRARSSIRILRAKVRPSGSPRGLQERLPDLQLAAQGIQRLRKALPDVLAKAADALSPRMKRIIETLAADSNCLCRGGGRAQVDRDLPDRPREGERRREALVDHQGAGVAADVEGLVPGPVRFLVLSHI